MEGISKEDLPVYQEQLKTVLSALDNSNDDSEKEELITLRDNLRELISLLSEDEALPAPSTSSNIDDEYAQFMKELHGEEDNIENKVPEESLLGKKCQAPHKHQWGDVVYHNAMVFSVIKDEANNEPQPQVRVMYTNPTDKEMLPCPYFLDSECKFPEEKCRFSHGEIVRYSSLKEYIEPNFDSLGVGSHVLAKKLDNLWAKGVVKRMYDNKCLVRLDSNKTDLEVVLEHIFPLLDKDNLSDSESEEDVGETEDIRPLSQFQDTFGEWEQYTKGMGSKMMQNMGYIPGTGLGPKADGRIEPVPAFVFPSGKSLDYCMNLKEKAGGDKNLFSVEKKLKMIQKKEERRNKQMFENEKNKVDVFNILNQTLEKPKKAEDIHVYKNKHRKEVKSESARGLNVAELRNMEDIRKVEKDILKIRESLTRHTDGTSQVHRVLNGKLAERQRELQKLQVQSTNISSEQKLRNDSKKLTIF